MRTTVAAGALREVRKTRTLTKLPVCLGFGVSTGQQARAVARAADGVVVGSALVQCVTQHLPNYQPALRRLARELATATHQKG